MDVVLFLVTPGVGTIMVAALIALAPAILSAWRDRILLARGREDPALPERLLATGWWGRVSIAVAIAVLVVFWQWHAIWAVALLFVARRWVVFRLRRALLGESWSFALYLEYFLRTAIGLGVMTLLVVLSPLIVGAADAGVARWSVACALGGLLGFWQVRHARVLLWLWRATPLDRVDNNDYAAPGVDANALIALQAACANVLARATTTVPARVWLAGPRGAVIANAVALPGVGEAHIVISRTLIERLTIDEIAAIVAHEAAHLEHFNRTRMTRQRLIALTQIAAGVLLIPILDATAPGLIEQAMIVWPLIVIVGLLARAMRVHGHELASDRRALELCSNPEALMSALTTVYTIGRQPRRWSAQAAKHPSLAQRLRALRQLAGFRPPAIEEIEIFDAPAGDAVLLLDGTTLQQASGVPPGTPRDAETLLARARNVRRADYTTLKAIRLVAPWRRPATLQVTERGGRRFDAQLRDADLPRLHDLLDIIEFGMPIEQPASLLSERDIAIGLLIVSIAIGQIWSLALLAALALIRPAAEILIGAGLALSLVGVLQWIDPTSSAATNLLPAWVIVALGGVAVDVVLWRLWSGRASQAKAPAWCVASVLAAAAIVWLHGLLQWDGSLLRLAQVARVTPAAMLLPLAAAVVVARVPVRGRRVLAAALAIAAIVPAVITTRWFQDEVVRDPLLAAAAPLTVSTGDVDVIGTSVSDGDSGELRLSPEGHVLAEAERGTDTERTGDFTIRTSDGQTRDLRADDLQFLDDTRALLLVSETDGLALRLENLGEKNKTEWSLTLPELRGSRLSLSPVTRRWRVIGHDGRGQVARLQGTIGEAEYDDVRWKADERGEALVGSGNAMLVSRTDGRASLLGRLLPELAMATSRRSSFDVSLWRVRAGAPTLLARSSADVDCVEAPVDVEPAVCFAFDGIATRLWMLSADDKRVTPIGVLPGYARPLTRGSDGTVVAGWQRHPVLLQLDPLRVRQLSTIALSRWARAALASNHLLIADGVDSPPLAIYRVQTELTRSASSSQP